MPTSLMDEYIGHEDLRHKLQQIIDNVDIDPQEPAPGGRGPEHDPRRRGREGRPTTRCSAAREILVADDEPNIRTTISDVLRKYHVDVTVCANGAEAIAASWSTHDFDLVISDIKMPDKTGYDVFAAAGKKSQTVPVILMTGFGYDPNHCIVRASQEGLQAVLFKPFKVEQLLDGSPQGDSGSAGEVDLAGGSFTHSEDMANNSGASYDVLLPALGWPRGVRVSGYLHRSWRWYSGRASVPALIPLLIPRTACASPARIRDVIRSGAIIRRLV